MGQPEGLLAERDALAANRYDLALQSRELKVYRQIHADKNQLNLAALRAGLAAPTPLGDSPCVVLPGNCHGCSAVVLAGQALVR